MVEPEEIFAEIKAQPPLMRERAKSTFIGKEIDWVLTLVDGWEKGRGYARLMFRRQPSDVGFVAANVPLSDCPWLKHTHAGETIRLRGSIADGDTLTIELKGASVSHVVDEAAH